MNPYLDTAPPRDTLPSPAPRASPLRRPSAKQAAHILATVCDVYGVTLGALVSHDKHRTIVQVRQAAMWLLRQAGYSYPEIGLLLGGRDHTTIMHGVAKVEADAGLVTELLGIRS